MTPIIFLCLTLFSHFLGAESYCQTDADCTAVLNSTGYCVNLYGDGEMFCVCPVDSIYGADPYTGKFHCSNYYICNDVRECNFALPKPYDTNRICQGGSCICKAGHHPDVWRCSGHTTVTMTKPSTTFKRTSMTKAPESKQFVFEVKKGPDEQECPVDFPDALLDSWNRLDRLPKHYFNLVSSKDAEVVGKEAVKNVTLGRDIVLPDQNYGELHLASDGQVGLAAFYYDPDWIVENMKESGTQLPAQDDIHHFTEAQWGSAELFGVGCTAYTDGRSFTKLYISMIWKLPGI